MAKHSKKCTQVSDEFFSYMANEADAFFRYFKCQRCLSCATLSIMIHMYAKLSPEVRPSLLTVFDEIVDKIGDESFEDNLDFATYITDGYEETK